MVPYLTDKDKHTALYKINKTILHKTVTIIYEHNVVSPPPYY